MVNNWSLKLGKIFNIEIKIHITWLIIFIFLSYALATGYFPMKYDFTYSTNIILGIIASLLLFVSILFHELAHSFVAKQHRIKVKGINLFFFGGVANISVRKLKPETEFKMAIAGPLFSLILGIIFLLLARIPFILPVVAIFKYLGILNIIIAIFNMLPGYPLDGGRAFRAILLKFTHDRIKATSIASKAGKFIGYSLVFLGFFSLLNGAGGLWLILIGFFITFLADMGYKQILIQEQISKHKVKDIMIKIYETIPNKKIKDIAKVLMETGQRVVKIKGIGFVSFEDIIAIPKNKWDEKVDIKNPKISAHEPLMHIFEKIKPEYNVFAVVDKGKIVGALHIPSILNLIKEF